MDNSLIPWENISISHWPENLDLSGLLELNDVIPQNNINYSLAPSIEFQAGLIIVDLL